MVAERVIPHSMFSFFDDRSGHVIVILQLVSRASSRAAGATLQILCSHTKCLLSGALRRCMMPDLRGKKRKNEKLNNHYQLRSLVISRSILIQAIRNQQKIFDSEKEREKD